MIISVEEGTKLATDLVSDLCQSAQNNNHAELMRHLFADIIEWKWVRTRLSSIGYIGNSIASNTTFVSISNSLMAQKARAAQM